MTNYDATYGAKSDWPGGAQANVTLALPNIEGIESTRIFRTMCYRGHDITNLNGRQLAALGCVIALAVAVGIIGAMMFLGVAGTTLVALSRIPIATPTSSIGAGQHMRPLDGTLRTSGDGYAMATDQDGATTILRGGTAQPSFFLKNGTAVRILQIDGSLVRVQVLEGEHRNRSGWLPANTVAP